MKEHNRPSSKHRLGGPLASARPDSSSDDDRDPLEALAAEYAERYRRGERVSVEQYARAYPNLAEEIRELFPAVSAMEKLHSKHLKENGEDKQLAKIEYLGDYRVMHEIARGGMGVIYEAEQLSLGRRVAVKVLPQNILRSPRDVQRFQREAKTASRLHHTNIVPVFGFGEHNGYHYIVMQLIRGVGLDEILAEMRGMLAGGGISNGALSSQHRSDAIKRSAAGLLQDTLVQGNATTRATPRVDPVHSKQADGALGDQQRPTSISPTVTQIRAVVGKEYYRNVARMGLQAAQALSYAHHHDILHRDVKPGNLILDEEGIVWMADFGLAKVMKEGTVTWSGDIVGTLGYMAPERFEGVTTARSDIYSLGLTLHELLTFDRVFDGADRVSIMHQVTTKDIARPRTLNPDVPKDLETIVLKATSRLPSDRYTTADAMVQDLEDFLADRPIKTRRMGPFERLQRWCRRNKAIAALAASVLVLLGVVGAMLTGGYLNARAEQQRAEKTSQLAVSALDEIYGQFAPGRLTFSSSRQEEAEALLEGAEIPLSKDVAVLLENLLHFYDELSRETSDIRNVAIKSIAANRRVGDIRRRLGEHERARDTYRQAIARFDDLAPDVRRTEECRIEFARIQNGLGLVLAELDLQGDAKKAHHESIAQFQRSDLSPTERFELARSLYLYHLAGSDGNCNDKEIPSPHLSEAITILDELQQEFPDVREYQFLLARCYLDCPTGCNADGTLNCEQLLAIQMLKKLVASAPDVADYRYELGDAYRSIEFREWWRKRYKKRPEDELKQSETRLRDALQVTEGLSIKNPNIPQYAVLRKRLYRLLAYALRDQGRLAEAADAMKQVIDSQRVVVQLASEGHRPVLGLYRAQVEYAQLLRDLEQNTEAKQRLEEVVASLHEMHLDPAVQADHGTRHAVKDLLNCSTVTLGCVLDTLGESEQAKAVLRTVEKPGT